MPKLHPQTGPVTVEGKQISSRNATTHGGTSEKLIIAGERQEDFDALLNDLLEEYAPATQQVRLLVEDAALARWFMWRKQRAYNAVESALYAAQPAQELWTAEAYHQLALVDRYKTAAERALKRALQNLDSLRRREIREQTHQIRSKKEEAQAQVAIARAHDALERRQREQWQAACNGFESPTLVQKISVTREGAIVRLTPSNEGLLREAERPSPFPAQNVCREFYFPNGVPEDYPPVSSYETYRNEKRNIVEQVFTFEAWRALTAEEPAGSHFVS
jgi:hypothetical protein